MGFLHMKPLRIRTKLAISYFVACLFPLTVSITLITWVSERKLEQSAREFASAYSASVTDSLDAFIGDFDSITKSLLFDADLIGGLSTVSDTNMDGRIVYVSLANKLSARASMLMKEAKGMAFYSASGNLYTYGITSIPDAGMSGHDAQWFSELTQTTDTIAIAGIHSVPYFNSNSVETDCITLARRIYNYEHRYLGTLLVNFEPQSILVTGTRYEGSQSIKDYRVVIRTEKGRLVVDSSGQDGTIPDSKNYIFYSARTAHLGLVVEVFIPVKSLRVGAWMVRMVSLFAGLLCFFLMALISQPIADSITKPIRLLQKQMNLAEQGEYEIAVFEDSSIEVVDLIQNYNNMIRRIRTLINEVYLADIAQKDAKLMALQTQINPHMLFNTLEVIRMKAITQGDMPVAEMVKALARMFRVMLSPEQGHTVRDELSYIADYFMFQKMRFPDLCELSIEVPDPIPGCEALPMILQPIVENAFAHGFVDRRKLFHIRIEGHLIKSNVFLSIENDGTSPNRAQLEKMQKALDYPEMDKTRACEHIGLVNIAERIRLRYGKPYGVEVSIPEHGGMRVVVCFPERGPAS